MPTWLKEFLALEAAGGLALMAVTVATLLIANSPLHSYYEALLAYAPFAVAGHEVTLSLFINDALMSIFFLLIGLEIKHELKEGELSSVAKALLPFAAALGGVTAPALIFTSLNAGGQGAHGWAVPTATDIAFSLGILAFFGSRVAPSLKIFLMALAVIDDLAAICIIAGFYTAHLDFTALAAAFSCAAILLIMNRKGVVRLAPYLAVGALMWAAVLVSGVHATVAGVVLGFLIPSEAGHHLVKRLHKWVVFGVVPLFAFANAGISLAGLSLAQVTAPIPLGIILGLVLGKQLGIFGTVWSLIRFKIVPMPQGATWPEIYAVSLLAGIGFTMSLFIGLLAYAEPELQLAMRLGVMTGSILSMVAGSVAMYVAIRIKNRHSNDHDRDPYP